MSDLYPAVDIVNGNIVGEQIVNTIGSLISVELEDVGLESDNVQDAIKEVNRKAVHFRGSVVDTPPPRDADIFGGRIFPSDFDSLRNDVEHILNELMELPPILIWENPDPNDSGKSIYDIAFDTSKYDELRITTDRYTVSVPSKTSGIAYMQVCGTSNTGGWYVAVQQRQITYGPGGISIGTGEAGSLTAYQTLPTVLVPLKVCGIKYKVNLVEK